MQPNTIILECLFCIISCCLSFTFLKTWLKWTICSCWCITLKLSVKQDHVINQRPIDTC
jgi:hypothetical protein